MSEVVLWHIAVSHYNEKARWALAHKGVEHERRAPGPPLHMPVALALTHGRHATFPILRLDGELIPDSTAIIAALEARFPHAPLYPDDPVERQRALELEDFFDEQVGPSVRLLAWHHLTRDPERLAAFSAAAAPGPLRRFPWLGAQSARLFVNLRYRVSSTDAAAQAREQVLRGFDRLESELDGGDYLVGDGFTVADLTAASLLYPLVLPPQAPGVFQDLPAPLEAFRASLRERPGYHWVQEMFRRHRQPEGARAAAAAA